MCGVVGIICLIKVIFNFICNFRYKPMQICIKIMEHFP